MRNRRARASDADRDQAVARLRDHAVAGRLTVEDLDERSGKAFSARTLDQLDALLADLPRKRRHEAAPERAIPLLLAQGILWVVVGVLLVTIAILWALAWAAARLAAAAAARAMDSRRPRALGGGA